MSDNGKIYSEKIFLIDNEISTFNPRRSGKLIKTMIISGIFSFLLVEVIIYTLPLAGFTLDNLFVFSCNVTLIIFLFILVFRYFSVLFMAYFFITRYTVKERNTFAPFVSIIVPVYNEALVIKDSITSLLNLNYKDYEIIIVNDGSTDHTKFVAQSFVGFQNGRYNKIKVSLIDKPNGGKSKALNAGIKFAQGEFILCMDGDSQLFENTLKYGISHFVDPSVGAVAGNVKVMNRKKIITASWKT